MRRRGGTPWPAAAAAWALTFLSALTAAEAEPRQQALDVSKQALEAYSTGQFGLAADLYQRAAQIDAEEPLYLYNAARASERAGRTAQAAALYRQFLARAPEGEPEVAKAQKYLAALEGEQRDAATAKSPPPRDVRSKPPSSTAAMPAPEASVRSAEPGRGGWIALATLGVSGLLAGGGLLVSGKLDQDELDRKLQQRNGSGLIVGIDHASAERQQSSINARLIAGWAAASVGAVAAVVGIVRLGSDSATLAVAPMPAGAFAASVRVRF